MLAAPHAAIQLAEAQRILADAIAEKTFPGAAFGVLFRGEEHIAAIGHLTYAPSSPAVTPATIYDLASLTKVIATTSMAMLLYDRGQLALDTPLETILPAFNPQRDPDRAKITLRMLLSHSSGLPAHEYLYKTCRTRDEARNHAIAACLTMPLAAIPGTAAVYSDIGFILLGLALEAIANEPLNTFCAREIFQPLGMTSTFFSPAPETLRPHIPPTEIDVTYRHRLIQGEVHDENAALLGGNETSSAGHAGLFSNVPDILRFARCILAGGRTAAGRQLFRPETVALFTTRTAEPPNSSRALGWDTPSAPSSSGGCFSPHSAGHLGFTGTSLWLDLERSLAVVLLTNRTWHEPNTSAPSQEPIRRLRPAFHDAVFHAINPGSPPAPKSP